MTYKKISKNPEWTVNPATYRLYKSFDWERWIMKACGITDDANNEVSRITNNRCRIDNASEGRQTRFGTMDESMLLKILGVDPGMTLVSSEIAFYSKEDRKKNR